MLLLKTSGGHHATQTCYQNATEAIADYHAAIAASDQTLTDDQSGDSSFSG